MYYLNFSNMGLFSKIFGGAKELTKISNGVANVTNMLDEYESNPDLTYLYVSAWITRVAVIDVVEANEFPSHYALYAPIHGNQTKMTIMEAYGLTITRVVSKALERSSRIHDYVQDILDKKEAFYEIDRQLPKNKKEYSDNINIHTTIKIHLDSIPMFYGFLNAQTIA